MADASSNRLIQSRMSTRQLNLLVQIAEKKSVLHAAEALHMTQSTASKMLIALENFLGVPLFVRQARGVEPTPFGEILIHHARCMLTQLEQAQKELNDIHCGVRGSVCIGTSLTSFTKILPDAVLSLKKAYPGIRVVLHQGNGEELLHRLTDCQLDIAITRSKTVSRHRNMEFVPLCTDTCCVVVNDCHPLVGKPDLSLEDLLDQTWVLPSPSTTMHHGLASLFMENGLPMPKSVIETSSLSTAMHLLRTSNVVVPMISGVVSAFYQSGRMSVLPLSLDFSLGSSGIAVLRDRPLSPAIKIMLDTLKRTAETLPKEDRFVPPLPEASGRQTQTGL